MLADIPTLGMVWSDCAVRAQTGHRTSEMLVGLLSLW